MVLALGLTALVVEGNLLTNADFAEGEDGKAGWMTFLNVFDPSGEAYKYGAAWDTGTAEVLTGSLTLEAHPGWTDNGNGPADLGDVIENNFFIDYGGDPDFAGQEVTFTGRIMNVGELPEGTVGQAFIKVLDGSWGLAEFLTADAETTEDGMFSLTTTVPTENMNAFQVGFLTRGPAGADAAILVDELSLTGDSGENLIVNPDFTEGEDGKDGWMTFLNVFDPTGEAYKYGAGWDTGTAHVNPHVVNLSMHPGWTDNGNGPADLGDVIENNFFVDYGATPEFAGKEVAFTGRFAVTEPLAEGTSGVAFIKVLDGAWGLAQFLTADVEMSPDGSFSLQTVVPTENMNAFQVGFAMTGPAGSEGSMLVWDLSLDEVEPLPWVGMEEGESTVSPWFGAFTVGPDGWLKHVEMGWIHVGGIDSEMDLWISSQIMGGWLWSQRGLFPVVYDFSGERWIYYFVLPGIGGYLYDYSTGVWEPVG
jgi:hypothetical protein